MAEETREEKFKRLAEKRVNAALDKIRLLGNLAHYKYSEEQAGKIVTSLRDAVSDLEVKLLKKAKQSQPFSLD